MTHYVPPPGPAPRPDNRIPRWPFFIGVPLMFIVLIAACGPAQPATRSSVSSSTGSNAVASAPAQAASSGPKTEFGDGTWVVGEDIVAGTYKSSGAKEGFFEFCSVSTYASDTGDGSVIGFDTANANEPIRIKVSGKVRSVKVGGCEPFTKVG